MDVVEVDGGLAVVVVAVVDDAAVVAVVDLGDTLRAYGFVSEPFQTFESTADFVCVCFGFL